MVSVKESGYSVGSVISVCLDNQLTFAAYRLPNTTEQKLIVQKKPEIEYISDLKQLVELKGFLIAPFLASEKNRMFIIRPDIFIKGEISDKQISEIAAIKHNGAKIREKNGSCEVTREEFLSQIESVIHSIKTGKIQKAVLSRIKVVPGDYIGQLATIFEKLCRMYPNAFVYVFKAEEHFWMGATPEPFAILKDHVFQTASVAGTRENIGKYIHLKNWGNKEKKEQQYVSDHIQKTLEKAKPGEILHAGPYVKKAGNLLHLRTDFTTNVGGINGSIGYLLEKLHPTPAICGYKTKNALKIIKATEKHDRQYYSGFLGPVGFDNSILLFVNLRCMQIYKSYLSLYTGGGITIDSIPEDEWLETEMKAGSLLSAIKIVK